MIAESLDVTQFDNLKTLQNYLDQHDEELTEHMEVTDVYIKYKNLCASDEEKPRVQAELDCFYTTLQANQVHFLATSHGKTGLASTVYPDLDKWDRPAFDYISRRAMETASRIFAARYYHLLWKAPSGARDRKNAVSAMEAYETVIRNALKNFENLQDNSDAARIGQNMEHLLGLASEVKERLEESRALMQELLFGKIRLPFFCVHGLAKDMLDYNKLFKGPDFGNILEFYEEEVKSAADPSGWFSLAKYYLPQATKIAQKTGADVRIWHKHTGDAYERLGDSDRGKDGRWLNQKYYADAILAFSMAGDDERKKQAQQKYAEIKPDVELTEFEIKPDNETVKAHETWHKQIREEAERLLQKTAEEIYYHITMAPLFPSGEQLSGNVKKNPFMELAVTVHFDRNKNVAAGSDGKNDLYNMMYHHMIRNQTIATLHNLFIPGVDKGVLNARNCLLYLSQNSWMGQPIAYKDLAGRDRQVDIIGLVAPAIFEFFAQLHAWCSAKYTETSFMLCIDSLTLKIEAVMRYFGQLVKIGTNVSRKKAIQEMYIHEILEEEEFQKYFSPDDLLFFKYLFSNNAGMNLRNNIAHAFYNVEDYTYDKMLLLMAAVLRIAKFKVSTEKMM